MQSFGVQIVCIHHRVFEFCAREKKKGKKNKVEICMLEILDCEKDSRSLGVGIYVTLE